MLADIDIRPAGPAEGILEQCDLHLLGDDVIEGAAGHGAVRRILGQRQEFRRGEGAILGINQLDLLLAARDIGIGIRFKGQPDGVFALRHGAQHGGGGARNRDIGRQFLERIRTQHLPYTQRMV